MHRNSPRTLTQNRTLIAVAFAIGLNASLLGALLHQPTRGEAFLIARNPLAVPMMVGTVTFSSLKAGFEAHFGHAGRDLRHAERNLLRGLHHGARAVGALISWSGTPANAAPAC